MRFLLGAGSVDVSEATKRREWCLVSSHGSAIFFVACNPGSSIDEIATGLSVTTRTAWSLVGDLRRAGLLSMRRVGRRNAYSVNPDAPFLHPTIRGITLGMVLGSLMEPARADAGAAPGPVSPVPAPAAPRRAFSRVG